MDDSVLPRVVGMTCVVGAMLVLPAVGYAQDATINGTVTDSTGGVLPGVKIYNLFNHENHGTYEVRESNASYGLPIPNPSLAYQPRMMQVGFRTTF